MGLDPTFIEQLLAPKKRGGNTPVTIVGVNKYPKPTQNGPMRFYDHPRKCDGGPNHRCGVSSYITIDGKPLCMIHSLHALNDMIIEMTEQKREGLVKG